MKEIHFHDANIQDEIIKVFKSDNPVAVLEFPKVFGLFAPHSLRGAEAISAVKKRLPGKYYSSFLGDDKLFQQMIPETLQSFLDFLLMKVQGVSIRLPLSSAIRHPDVATHNQTHQILIEKPSMRSFIRQLDRTLQTVFLKSDFYDVNYQSPLVSSLNLSGSLSGSIIRKEEALFFAQQSGIPLFIHSDELEGPLGSYPIFYVSEKGAVVCERKGLDHEAIDKELVNYWKQYPLSTGN